MLRRDPRISFLYGYCAEVHDPVHQLLEETLHRRSRRRRVRGERCRKYRQDKPLTIQHARTSNGKQSQVQETAIPKTKT